MVKKPQNFVSQLCPKYSISGENISGCSFDHRTKSCIKRRENLKDPTVGTAWFLQKVARVMFMIMSEVVLANDI